MLTKKVIENKGKLIPLIISTIDSPGTGLMNPSIFNDNGKLIVNIRHINYILWHSENKQIYNSRYGPLVYFNPEDDVRLATKNYICTLNKDLSITDSFLVKTERCDSPNPLWEFHGLEDARLIRWNETLYQTGVRRDTTPNGEGRMELSEIVLTDWECFEISRQRIPMPEDQKSYCEKNWMPIIDMPFHYVKWSNPTEVIKYDPEKKETTIVYQGKNKIEGMRDFRGGAQVIPYKDYHICLIHECDLFTNIQGQKDGIYRHRFVTWDKDWNIVAISEIFDFMNARIEFAGGMCLYKNDLLISFGFQDNAAFILQVPEKIIDELLELGKIPHIYHQERFGEEWFTFPEFYKEILDKFPSGSKFVELGSWKGRSAAFMATEIANSKKKIDFYCVDIGEEAETLTNNLKTLEKYYTFMKMDTQSAVNHFADRSLDFVFVDAGHSYEDVKADILSYYPKIKVGGIIAGHDYKIEDHPGVVKAVDELINPFKIVDAGCTKCWMHEVTGSDKLDGLPSVYCISLEESKDRRNNLQRHFMQYGKSITFCNFPRYAEGDLPIKGSRLNEVNLHAKGSNTSNLLAIKRWYDETNEDCLFMCEDDLSLETVSYWSFTWKDFFKKLPPDWECVQLLQVRNHFDNHKLKVREANDFCNAAFILKRHYAKRILDKYIVNGVFILECDGIPVPENILFTLGNVYSMPLFVEDVPNTVSTFPGDGSIRHSEMHESSYEEIVAFWKTYGDKYTINDFMPKSDSWKDVIDPIIEITTNIHSNGCIINCAFCPQMTLISNYNGSSFLSMEDFKTAIDKLPLEIGVIFAGLSEPFLNIECTDMVMYAHEKGHTISIFTTGVGMKPSDIDRIKSIPFSGGYNRGFVLHLPDTEGYANHPITPKYIDLLRHIKNSNISNLWVVSMGTVPDMVSSIFPEVDKAVMYSRAGNLQKEELLKPKLKKLSTNYLSVDNGEGKISCASPEGTHHTVMLPNGDISICCQDYSLQHIVGNILTQEYKDIVPFKDTPFELCRHCENGKVNT